MIGCSPSDPCASLTLSECEEASRSTTDAKERARFATRACELGSAPGCSSLGLQLLLDSEDNDARRRSSYRAFRKSCSDGASFLCLYPSFVEINRESPDGDLVINGFAAHCAEREGDACYLVAPAKQRLGMVVSDEAIAESQAMDDAILDYSFDDWLRLEGFWGPQIRALPTLPADTPGNLWTYGMSDEE